jgi:FMN-dependent oxidoreductase (nitrilotriacetate monooxygenase family)
MAKKRQIKLGTFLTVGGEHVGAWRHPDSPRIYRSSFQHSLEIARTVEDALFDLVLVADVQPTSTNSPEMLKYDPTNERLDPVALTSALAVTTSRVGLIATASTSFEQPYHVARMIASIDQMSAGRGGWNCVTTSNTSMALNFNQEAHLPPAERYRRAEEFVDVVRGLWNSWDDDAFIRDKSSGVYFDPRGLHILDHKGAHFSVRGPLDVVRSPQGEPVIVQAGSSEPGRALAARVADVVFTTHPRIDAAREFYADIKKRAVKQGRNPNDVLILLALMPVVGATRAEAQAKVNELDALIPPPVALARLSSKLGDIDLSAYPRDEPLPDNLPAGTGMLSRRQPFIDLGKREGLTMMQLAARTAGNRGHWTVVGTAAEIADQMQERFEGGAADGFLLVPPRTPDSLCDFGTHVVPELQRRGIYRTAYEGATLRENLGLSCPRMADEPGLRSVAS